jgi:hypothetical protein
MAEPITPNRQEATLYPNRLLAHGLKEFVAQGIVDLDADVFEHGPEPENRHREEDEGEERG